MRATNMTSVEARSGFADVINRVAYGGERVMLTRHGKTIAAVVPVEDVELLQELENSIDLKDAKLALKEKGSLSSSALRKELGL